MNAEGNDDVSASLQSSHLEDIVADVVHWNPQLQRVFFSLNVFSLEAVDSIVNISPCSTITIVPLQSLIISFILQTTIACFAYKMVRFFPWSFRSRPLMCKSSHYYYLDAETRDVRAKHASAVELLTHFWMASAKSGGDEDAQKQDARKASMLRAIQSLQVELSRWLTDISDVSRSVPFLSLLHFFFHV